MIKSRREAYLAAVVACAALAISGCGQTAPQDKSIPAPLEVTTPAAPEMNQRDAMGSWKLVHPGEVTAESTTLYIEVTRESCAGGETGKVLTPEVQEEAGRFVIRTPVEPIKDGYYTCQSNNWVPITVVLPAPIGDRELFDAACLDSFTLTTATCAYDQGVRWKP